MAVPFTRPRVAKSHRKYLCRCRAWRPPGLAPPRGASPRTRPVAEWLDSPADKEKTGIRACCRDEPYTIMCDMSDFHTWAPGRPRRPGHQAGGPLEKSNRHGLLQCFPGAPLAGRQEAPPCMHNHTSLVAALHLLERGVDALVIAAGQHTHTDTITRIPSFGAMPSITCSKYTGLHLKSSKQLLQIEERPPPYHHRAVRRFSGPRVGSISNTLAPCRPSSPANYALLAVRRAKFERGFLILRHVIPGRSPNKPRGALLLSLIIIPCNQHGFSRPTRSLQHFSGASSIFFILF